jgi:aldose 1-epimerase
VLTVHADGFLPLDADGIPSGVPVAVAGTPLDFRSPEPLGPRMAERGGYDDCFMLGPVELTAAASSSREPRLAALVYEPHQGRTLELLTDQPALQLFTANSLDGSPVGHNGVRYQRHAGLCLETRHPPDAPDRPDLPGARLDPGQTYRARVRYRFGIHG